MTKVDALRELQYSVDTEVCLELLKKWTANTDNEELNTFMTAFLRICTVNAGLTLDKDNLLLELSKERETKLKYYKRGMELKQELDEIKGDGREL